MTLIYDDRNNIYELQTMLREISKKHRDVPLINPDGIYGEDTTNAVLQVQKIAGLPQSGEVDFNTWKIIVDFSKI